MMYPIIISFIFAIVFAILLPSLFRRSGPGPWRGIVFYFLIIFLFTWALGSWVTPVGPVVYETSWVSYLVISFFMMILIAALVPADPKRNKSLKEQAEEAAVRRRAANVAGATFGVFFWVLILILLAAGIAGILLL